MGLSVPLSSISSFRPCEPRFTGIFCGDVWDVGLLLKKCAQRSRRKVPRMLPIQSFPGNGQHPITWCLVLASGVGPGMGGQRPSHKVQPRRAKGAAFERCGAVWAAARLMGQGHPPPHEDKLPPRRTWRGIFLGAACGGQWRRGFHNLSRWPFTALKSETERAFLWLQCSPWESESGLQVFLFMTWVLLKE